MPATNAVKKYIRDGVYHVYNRGNNREFIYNNEDDYILFKYLFSRYLCKQPERRRLKNYSSAIRLHAFCLMPNHFHLILKQLEERSMVGFMRSLLGSYSLIFNKKYGRVGHIFQGVYKARLIETAADLYNVADYVHLNPTELGRDPVSYQYSSLRIYLGLDSCDFLSQDLLGVHTALKTM